MATNLGKREDIGLDPDQGAYCCFFSFVRRVYLLKGEMTQPVRRVVKNDEFLTSQIVTLDD